MPLHWTQHNTTYHAVYALQAADLTINTATLKQAVGSSIEQACGLLKQNIQDDSLYFLCQWQPATATLTLTVTNSTKQQDGPWVVCCEFRKAGAQAEAAPLNTDDIHYAVRDYLTTCASFMRYSLVAAFCCDNRDNCTLL